MPFRSSFNPAPLRRSLQNRRRGLQASLPELMDRAGRLISVSAATSSQPYGTDDGARKSGAIATERDIRKVYASPGQVFDAFPNKQFARAFWDKIKKGNFAGAQKIMQDKCPRFHNKELKPFDGGIAHRAARNSRGRVSRRMDPAFVVQTGRNLLAYISEEVDLVGFGKAGWATCAKILGGTRGLSQWITRHADSGKGKKGKAPGLVIKDFSKDGKATYTLRNQVDYAGNILDDSAKNEAVNLGLDRLAKAIQIEERRLASAHPLN